MTDISLAAVISGSLVMVIAFACRLGRNHVQDPKLMFLNALMRRAAHGHQHDHF